MYVLIQRLEKKRRWVTHKTNPSLSRRCHPSSSSTLSTRPPTRSHYPQTEPSAINTLVPQYLNYSVNAVPPVRLNTTLVCAPSTGMPQELHTLASIMCPLYNT